MTEAPRVSVVIPTYDRAGAVVGAVESVLRQSFRDLEIIVADDGSTDDTAERIARLEGPIRFLGLPHSGFPARARNRALDQARGELVAFLDDDDRWEGAKLARQVALLDLQPAVGLVYTGFSIEGDDGSVHAPELASWETRPGPLLDRLLRGCFIHPSTVVVRADLLDQVGGFDERRPVAEDYDLWLRLAPLTRGACIDEPLARLRRGTANQSVRNQALVYEVTISILEDRLAAGGLDLRLRMRCRTAISDLHTNAARLAREAGDRGRGRKHAARALYRNPLRKHAWSTFLAGRRP